MTDFEYILQDAKLFYYKGWEAGELRKCIDMLPNLTHEELVKIYTNRWVNGSKLKDEIFNILYMDRLGEREERIKEMSTNELINEFEERRTGNIALIRQELRYRYKEDFGDDRIKIAAVFRRATKGDQKWIELQMRRMFHFVLAALVLLFGGCLGETHKEVKSPVVLTDAMVDSAIQSLIGNHPLSSGDSIVTTGDVSWRIIWVDNGVELMTSVEPDSPQMKPIIDYLNKLFGEPSVNEENVLVWSDITFQGLNCNIRLHRARHETEGTIIIID